MRTAADSCIYKRLIRELTEYILKFMGVTVVFHRNGLVKSDIINDDVVNWRIANGSMSYSLNNSCIVSTVIKRAPLKYTIECHNILITMHISLK